MWAAGACTELPPGGGLLSSSHGLLPAGEIGDKGETGDKVTGKIWKIKSNGEYFNLKIQKKKWRSSHFSTISVFLRLILSIYIFIPFCILRKNIHPPFKRRFYFDKTWDGQFILLLLIVWKLSLYVLWQFYFKFVLWCLVIYHCDPYCGLLENKAGSVCCLALYTRPAARPCRPSCAGDAMPSYQEMGARHGE